jgi:dienelactone hydrolase
MKMPRIIWMAAIVATTVSLGNTAAFARTKVQPLALEAKDGNRITGLIMQDANAVKDAPLAILMHGMTGSSLHWLVKDNNSQGDDLTSDLVQRGYRVVALDARSHGVRKDDLPPMKRVEHLRAGQSEAYLAMINGTLNDYDVLLEEVKSHYGQPRHILVMGYSMGAQMAVLFAAKHKEVSHIVTMVPPAVKDAPSVAPVTHAHKVRANWLLLTASRDQFSTRADRDALVKAAGDKMHRVEYDSPHMLPQNYVDAVINWVANIPRGTAADK